MRLPILFYWNVIRREQFLFSYQQALRGLTLEERPVPGVIITGAFQTFRDRPG